MCTLPFFSAEFDILKVVGVLKNRFGKGDEVLMNKIEHLCNKIR